LGVGEGGRAPEEKLGQAEPYPKYGQDYVEQAGQSEARQFKVFRTAGVFGVD
jgi:hypothetical protein